MSTHNISDLFANLLPASEAAVKVALGVFALDGVAGTMIVSIPAKAGRPVDVRFTVGQVTVAFDMKPYKAA